MTTQTAPRIFVHRQELVDQMVARDGLVCQFPDCGRPLDLNAPEGPLQVTIDHWMPQWWGKENGWTIQQIWDITNLKLMHKKCNAKKGDRVPNEDGTIPEKIVNKFRYRRDKRAERPEICTACNAGRALEDDEICASCGSGPMPLRWERWRKMSSKDCDHQIFWCSMCGSGVIPRVGATDMIIAYGEGGEGSSLEDAFELNSSERI